MVLVEQGRLDLRTPVADLIPAFNELTRFAGGGTFDHDVAPVRRRLRIGHLLAHTAGLTYGANHAHPVDELHRRAGFELGPAEPMDLAAACERWASIPLLYEPGTGWSYSCATDVLGRVLEVVDGRPLDEVLHDLVLAPLDMGATSFDAEADPDRVPGLYAATRRGLRRADDFEGTVSRRPTFLSGGHGLVTTAADYLRFLASLLAGGVVQDRTVAAMARNQLPEGGTLDEVGIGIRPSAFAGMGFGLGFAVLVDPRRAGMAGSVGDCSWSGAGGSTFWFDRAEDLGVVLLTHAIGTAQPPLRRELRHLVHDAVVA
jgi:CubicO group peptidase (beta-lactamase class C family)